MWCFLMLDLCPDCHSGAIVMLSLLQRLHTTKKHEFKLSGGKSNIQYSLVARQHDMIASGFEMT